MASNVFGLLISSSFSSKTKGQQTMCSSETPVRPLVPTAMRISLEVQSIVTSRDMKPLGIADSVW